MKTSAFIIRRARLLQALTQAEFGEQFDADDLTVSQWERGLLEPSAPTYAKIRRISRTSDPLAHALVEASPVFKYLAPMDDLKEPVAISKGVRKSLARVGYSGDEFLGASAEGSAVWAQPSDPTYHWSFSRALTLTQADPRWLSGEITYVEIHAYSPTFRQWGRALVAPMPGDALALIEGVFDAEPSEEFWIRCQHGSEQGSLLTEHLQ